MRNILGNKKTTPKGGFLIVAVLFKLVLDQREIRTSEQHQLQQYGSSRGYQRTEHW